MMLFLFVSFLHLVVNFFCKKELFLFPIYLIILHYFYYCGLMNVYSFLWVKVQYFILFAVKILSALAIRSSFKFIPVFLGHIPNPFLKGTACLYNISSSRSLPSLSRDFKFIASISGCSSPSLQPSPFYVELRVL